MMVHTCSGTVIITSLLFTICSVIVFVDGFKVNITNRKLNINKEINLTNNSAGLIENGIFDKAGKYIAAICAAPSIFGHKGILEKRNACCYPSYESHLTGAVVSRNPGEVSAHVITSRGMGTAIEFALQIVACMKGQACADAVKEAIIYQG